VKETSYPAAWFFLKINFLINWIHGKLIHKLLIFPMATSKTVEAPCSFVETDSSVKNHDQIYDVFTEGITGEKMKNRILLL